MLDDDQVEYPPDVGKENWNVIESWDEDIKREEVDLNE